MDRHPHQDAERADILLSAALYLISRYAAAAAQGSVCSRLAVSIQCHLEILAERTDVARLVRDTCGLLAEEWRRSVANEAERPCGPALLALVARARMR
ncbi:MAG: hypothetical protein N2544_04860 [Burkholderiales bacterium]|nr:hypothetical protein [Burkholderiales bacterium]